MKSRVVKVREGRDQSEEKPKKRPMSAPPLNNKAGVGEVGEGSNPIRLNSRSRTPLKRSRGAGSALAG